MKATIVYHQRLPADGQVSIERLFGEIRRVLAHRFNIVTATSPKYSKGLLNRFLNLLFARRQQGQIHHIVGDVHYLAFSLQRRNLVLSIMDCASLGRLTGWRRSIMRYFWFTGPMRRASVVTTISHTTKSELKKWVGSLADKVVVIPCCVRPEFVAQPKTFNETSPVALQVGTSWNKNLERVAESLVGIGCRLEVIGELTDSQRSLLKANGTCFKELGRISHKEVCEAYNRCDFVIFASLYEGFGLPILEAQSVGRPVITSNCSSMPEVAGGAALLVDPHSTASIRDAVVQIIQSANIRESLIDKGFKNVRNFSVEGVASSYSRIYEQVLTQQMNE
jgi:glycosyltransferase involved in cell wall biosynthesis